MRHIAVDFARMSRRVNPQPSLFGDDKPADAAALVTVAARQAPLTAAQKKFNDLTAKIRREREKVETLTALMARVEQRVAGELIPEARKARAVQRRFVLALSALLDGHEKGDRLSRRQLQRTRTTMLRLIADLLFGGEPDPELETLHERYTGLSRQDRERDDVSAAEALVSMMFGDDAIEGHQAKSSAELFEYAQAKLHEQEQTKEAKRQERAAKRRARRNTTDKKAASDATKADPERDATQAVRDIFRKLASALHPDRERDATERDRKTLLMQRVNEAYDRHDLLGLLTLQFEIEQIDADHLSHVPDARLVHYNQVLREQLDILRMQAFELSDRICWTLEMPNFGRLTQGFVDRAFDERIAALRSECNELERDLPLLADRRMRKHVIDGFVEDFDGDDFDVTFEVDPFDPWPDPPRRQRAGGRRKARKRAR
jgi:hypothetical protein